MASENVKRVDVNKEVQSNYGSKWIKKIIGNKIKIVNNGAYEIERYPYDKKQKK
jgi:hypothetical protein